MKFSTKDRDNEKGCVGYHSGGWWYNWCFSIRLTGQHTKSRGRVSGDKQIGYWNGGNRTPPTDSLDSWMEAQMLLLPKATSNKLPSTVDCKVGDWKPWGDCSATCGGGTKTRAREVVEEPENGGAVCPDLEETESCNTDQCEETSTEVSAENVKTTEAPE